MGTLVAFHVGFGTAGLSCPSTVDPGELHCVTAPSTTRAPSEVRKTPVRNLYSTGSVCRGPRSLILIWCEKVPPRARAS